MSFQINWDAVGITASLACAIHCAILPLLVSTLPVFGVNIIDNAGFEYFMIFLSFAVGGYSLGQGYRAHHRRFTPMIVFSMGISLLFAKQIWHSHQFWLLPTAVVLVVMAHVMNYRFCQGPQACSC